MNLNNRLDRDRAPDAYMDPAEVIQAARTTTLAQVKELSQPQRQLLIGIINDNMKGAELKAYDADTLTNIKQQLENPQLAKKTVLQRMKRAFDAFCETMHYGYDRINSDDLMQAIREADKAYLASENVNANTFKQGKPVMKDILRGHRALMQLGQAPVDNMRAKLQVYSAIQRHISDSYFHYIPVRETDVSGKPLYRTPTEAEKLHELHRLWTKGCEIFQETSGKALSDQDRLDVMELLVLSLNIPLSFVDAKYTSASSDQALQAMMNVVFQAVVNIAKADKEELKKLERDEIIYQNEQAKLTDERLQQAKALIKGNMAALASGNLDANLNPWRLTSNEAAFYLSNGFKEVMEGKATEFDAASTNEARLAFIQALYKKAARAYLAHLSEQKGRAIEGLDGDQALAVMVQLVLELNIKSEFLFAQIDLTKDQQIGAEGLIMAQVNAAMLFLSSRLA